MEIILRRNKPYAYHHKVKPDKKLQCYCGCYYTMKSKYKHFKSLLHKNYYYNIEL